MEMKELAVKVGKLSNDELILDVRSPEEFQEGHVPGARNIPYVEVAKHASELKRFKTIYLHCMGGGRAQKATEALKASGLSNIQCISGSGMRDWLAAGLPIEK